jgi:hypothetical protein
MKRYLALILMLASCTTTPVTTMPTPTPSPSPSPTPSSSPTPSPLPTPTVVEAIQDLERPTSSTVWATSLTLNLAVGESTARHLNFTSCLTPALENVPPGVVVQLYSEQTITTTVPSYQGARVGAFIDPLIPYQSGCLSGNVLLDVTVASGTPGVYSFQVNDLSVSLTINKFAMPTTPLHPMYVGLEPQPILAAHNLSPNTNVSVQGPLTMSYVNLLRAHRLEPYGQEIGEPAVVSGALNVTQWSQFDASFQQTNITGSLGKVCLDPHNTAIQNAAYYAAAQSTMTSLGFKAWNYLIDEPHTASSLATALSLAQASKAAAPSLETMVTVDPSASVALQQYVDHFTVVFEQFKQPGFQQDYSSIPNYWLYGGCMSHGSCSNGTTGSLTGTPDLMIDDESINARMFPVVAAAMGAQSSLYYSVDQAYGQMNVFQNQYLFGGNGDGTLVYPAVAGQMGFTANAALPSYRLKMLRQGMFDAEYGAVFGFSGVVTSQFNWSHSHAALDALRAIPAIQP